MPNINCIDKPPEVVIGELLPHCLDITGPQDVEVKFDKERMVLWINVNGICALRACRIGNLVFEG